MKKLDDSNFMLYGAANYDNPQCYDTDEFHDDLKRFPLEKKIIHFSDNGNYKIASELIFNPPLYDKKTLFHIYNSNSVLIEKINKNTLLNKQEKTAILNLPASYLILKLNGFKDSKQKLNSIKWYFKKHSDELYQEYKEVLRVLRKVKYQ